MYQDFQLVLLLSQAYYIFNYIFLVYLKGMNFRRNFFSWNLQKLAKFSKFDSLKLDGFPMFIFFLHLHVSPFIMDINFFLILRLSISIK